MTGYTPGGKTFEHRMQAILLRRERWLIDHPEAGACTVLVHPSDMDGIGFWLKAKGVAVASLPRGGPQPGTVWFADSAEVGA